MKRIIFIGFAAIMAFAFTSCQKEAEIDNANENKLVEVVLRAEKAGETRTAAVESDTKVSYVWTNEDVTNFKLYQVITETTDKGTTEKYTAIENPTLTFSEDNRVLTVAATVPASSTLRAFVAGNWTNSETKPNPRLKIIQNPVTDNFDPTADILVAEDQVIPADATTFNGTLKFNRPVTVNKMTLKGLAEGETVSKVTLTSTNHLSGYYNTTNSSMTGDGKELTMQYSNAAVSSKGEFPVYFVAVPKEGHTLTVVVETSKDNKNYSYTKTFGSDNINFATGNFGKFSVNLAGLAEEVTDVDYSGEWIIAGTDGGHDLAATPWSSGYVYPASVVTLDPDNQVVTVKGETDPYKMTITRITSGDYAGLYTIEDENGAFLSATGGTKNNNLTGKDDPDETSYWSIEKNTDGTYNIIADKLADDFRKSMRVNYNSGNPRVTCYAISSGQPKVVLYPFAKIKVDDTPAETFDFKKVTTVTSGKQYLLVAFYNNKYYSGLVNGSNYGYLQSEVVTPADDIITVDDLTNAITIETSGSGYSMLQSNGKYIYANGNYNTLNYGTNPSNTWTIEPQTDGTFKFTSIGTFIQFGQGDHTTFGRWESAQTDAVMPYLYEYQEGPAKEVVSIAVSDVSTTEFFTGDTFVFDGKVTATYDDGTTEDVTSSASVATPDMTTVGTKTVTVTYDGKQASYEITVNAKPVISIPGGTEKNWDCKNRSWNIQYVLTNAVGDEWETECVSDVEWITVAYSTQATDGTYRMVRLAANEGAERIGHVTFTYRNADPVTVTITQAKGEGYIEPPKTATILFGNNNVKINAANVTGQDDQNNTWTITTEGTESFTSSTDYYQVGSSKKPATSITFTTTLPDVASITSMSAKFGGFSGTAGTVDLKVGSNSIGTGALNEANDVTVSSTSTAQGTVLTVSVTGISKGVKVYSITVTYEN